jgi:hypothetical protein
MGFNPAQITFNSFKEMFLSEQCEQLVMVTKMPQCSRCFGTNWIDLGLATHKTDVKGFVIPPKGEHFYQCGGGVAHTDPNDMKMGCERIIRATPEEMSKGGQI